MGDLYRILRAWTDPGPNAQYHRMMQRKLLAEWPALATAIRDAAIAAGSDDGMTDDRCQCGKLDLTSPPEAGWESHYPWIGMGSVKHCRRPGVCGPDSQLAEYDNS